MSKLEPSHQFSIAGGQAMIIHGVDFASFCRRHDLEPFEAPCNGCGRPVTQTAPFAAGKYRGIMTACECGHIGAPYQVAIGPGLIL